MLKLYDYFRSSACFRVRIALNLKKIPYEKIPIHLINNGGEQHSNAYQAINPQALVPTLQDHQDYFTQSLAIIEYLNDIYPEPPLLPADVKVKAMVRSFALTIAADMHPLNNLRVLNYLQQQLHITEEQKTAWYQHWMHLGLQALEARLQTQSHHRYHFTFGNDPSLADICLVQQLYNARRFHCDISAFPELQRVDEHCQTHPAFQAAWPVEQPMAST
jgi:maleylacetoacetate isomerase